MNYTDRFFEFPIRVYDGFASWKAMIKEERAMDTNPDDAEPEQGRWTAGFASVRPDEIKSWNDTFSKDITIEDVEKNGFDTLLVETVNGGYACLWSSKRFKAELDKWWKRLKDGEAQAVDTILTTLRSGKMYWENSSDDNGIR